MSIPVEISLGTEVSVISTMTLECNTPFDATVDMSRLVKDTSPKALGGMLTEIVPSKPISELKRFSASRLRSSMCSVNRTAISSFSAMLINALG